MKVAFLVNDLQLSGGLAVVVRHARLLGAAPDWDVSLVLVREDDGEPWREYVADPAFRVLPRRAALAEHFDIAIATWWETTFTLFELNADRHAYFVQSLEDRFYGEESADRLGAALTLDLPVNFITEAAWIAQTLSGLRPDAPCHLVRNGIDKAVFGPAKRLPARADGPLQVLVEGSSAAWFKDVAGALAAIAAMREPHVLTVVSPTREAALAPDGGRVVGPLSQVEMAVLYGEVDVLVKLSRVEGMFGPPLEGFHRGATCVVTPVTGYEEYIEHGWNGLLTDWDDRLGTARQLDLLARDRELLTFLRRNALATARRWPSWEESGTAMAAALRAIAAAPPGNSGAAAARMLADLREGLEIYRGQLDERADYRRRAARYERLAGRLKRTLVGRLLRLLRSNRYARRLARPFRPLLERLARRALG